MCFGLQIVPGVTSSLPLNKSIDSTLTKSNMSEKEQKEAVLRELKYMIAEGMVVETKPGYYRLKTERELEQEMYNLYNDK
jgi:hypothetical protein